MYKKGMTVFDLFYGEGVVTIEGDDVNSTVWVEFCASDVVVDGTADTPTIEFTAEGVPVAAIMVPGHGGLSFKWNKPTLFFTPPTVNGSLTPPFIPVLKPGDIVDVIVKADSSHYLRSYRLHFWNGPHCRDPLEVLEETEQTIEVRKWNPDDSAEDLTIYKFDILHLARVVRESVDGLPSWIEH